MSGDRHGVPEITRRTGITSRGLRACVTVAGACTAARRVCTTVVRIGARECCVVAPESVDDVGDRQPHGREHLAARGVDEELLGNAERVERRAHTGFTQASRDGAADARLDEVLAKIAREGGRGGLTEEEHRILEEASRRARDRRSDRV